MMIHGEIFVVDPDITVGVCRGKCKDFGANAIDDGRRCNDRWTSVAAATVRTPSNRARHSGRRSHSGWADGDGESCNGSVSRVVDLSRSLSEDAGSQECHNGHGLGCPCHGRRMQCSWSTMF